MSRKSVLRERWRLFKRRWPAGYAYDVYSEDSGEDLSCDLHYTEARHIVTLHNKWLEAQPEPRSVNLTIEETQRELAKWSRERERAETK